MVLLFDLDETLIGTTLRQFTVVKHFFDAHSLVFDVSYLEYVSERKASKLSNFEFVSNHLKSPILLTKFKEDYLSNIESFKFLKKDELIVDVKLLDKLTELDPNLDFRLLSLRSNETNSIRQMKHLGLHKYFANLTYVRHAIENPKTSVIKMMKEKDNNIIFVGDSDTDYDAAFHNQISFMGVKTNLFEQKSAEMKYKDVNAVLQKLIDDKK